MDPLPPEVAAAPPDARLGRYVLVQRIGSGGFGEVWKAWDTQLARWTAVKLLKGRDDEEIARFTREAQTAGRLSHPHIAAVYEVGQEGGRHFIAMQLIDGQTLKTYPRTDRAALVRLVRDAARAVAHAHGLGIVHRDLKPENIMVERGTVERSNGLTAERVFVMDFGLARAVHGGSKLSVSGTVVGTPAYMSPQQARGERVDARTDVYSLGATLYEILADRPPFHGRDIVDILVAVCQDEPRPPRRIDPSINADLETIVLKCLEKDADRRYPSAAALADDLDRFLAGEPISARPASFVYRLRKRIAKRKGLVALAFVAVIALGATLAILLTRLTAVERTRRLWGDISDPLSQAEIYERAGHLDEARKRLDRGIEVCRRFLQSHESAHARYFLGRLLRRRGDRDAARAELDRAVALDGSLGEARYERGLLLVTEFDRLFMTAYGHRVVGEEDIQRHAPLRELRRLIVDDLSAAAGTSSYFHATDALYGRAELARIQWRPDQAESLLRQILEKEPLHAEACISLAYILTYTRRLDEAEEMCARASKANRGLRRAFSARATLLLERIFMTPHDPRVRQWSGAALADAEHIVELDPDAVTSYLVRGLARVECADLDGALADYNRALDLDPRFGVAYFNRGIVHGKRGDWARAKEDFDRAATLGDVGHDLFFNRGAARAKLGDLPGAIEDFTRAIGLHPAPDTFAARGMQHHARGDPARAEADYDEAIRRDPRCANAWLGRGNILSHRGDAAGAIAAYTSAIEAAPEVEEPWYNRGLAHFERRDFASAVRDFTEAYRIERAAITLVNRALAYEQSGDLRRALADFEEAAKTAGGDDEAKVKAAAGLQRLRK